MPRTMREYYIEEVQRNLPHCDINRLESLAREAQKAIGAMRIPPSIERWHAIADAIKEVTGFPTTLEGGGAACPFIRVTLPDGRIILFGDNGETWRGDTYANAEAESRAEMLDGTDCETGVSTIERDPAFIARAFKAAITDVCITGNPAILGRCGEPGCVCAPQDTTTPVVSGISLDKSELATVLAALRFFQRGHDGWSSEQIHEAWPDHFTDDNGKMIPPLGAECIDALCEYLNTGGTR